MERSEWKQALPFIVALAVIEFGIARLSLRPGPIAFGCAAIPVLVFVLWLAYFGNQLVEAGIFAIVVTLLSSLLGACLQRGLPY